jgi:cytosine/adenosine deaminase-related metal-dependent hydrolase
VDIPPNSQPSSLNPQPILLRSRIVLPIARPPIENGAVLISGNSIVQVGPWKNFSAVSAEIIDLGESILLPGLINAHCHLDYTRMAGMLPPQKAFTDWIKLMLAVKAQWTYTEYADSWVHGAQSLLRTGTTTVVDFEAVPELLPEVWSATPLRVISLLEMTGVKNRREPGLILEEALNRIAALSHKYNRAGLAPHAPYSTASELVRLSAKVSQERHWPISIHLSESDQEFEMFAHASGGMFDWLRRNERDMADCGLGSPIEHLERQGALKENLLAVHVNYLGPSDADLLCKNKVSVVHCPRSHSYFRHQKFSLQQLTAAGVNVCLGTDSLATVYKKPRETIELSLFEEMRALTAAQPELAPETILKMATINGARALNMARQVGEISEKSLADLIAIPFTGNISEAENAIMHHRGNVAASMINGEWVIPPAD